MIEKDLKAAVELVNPWKLDKIFKEYEKNDYIAVEETVWHTCEDEKSQSVWEER